MGFVGRPPIKRRTKLIRIRKNTERDLEEMFPSENGWTNPSRVQALVDVQKGITKAGGALFGKAVWDNWFNEKKKKTGKKR